MFELIENIKLLIQNRDKVAFAVLFIAICHMIPIVIEYFKREKEEKIVCVVEFKLFVKVQMLAFFLSIIYVTFYSFLSESDLAWLLIIIFYGFLIKIIMTQNESNGGYVTEWNELSGTILFITATLQPWLFIAIYIINIFYHKWMIKREEDCYNHRYLKIKKRIIDIVETALLWLLVSVIPMNTFVGTIIWNSILISVFSFALPPLNNAIFSRVE